MSQAVKNVVLVHGGFVDGSGWQGVYDQLTQDGYHVAVVQNPTISLAGDVAATEQILDELDGPAVLVGHSYGGVVVSARCPSEPARSSPRRPEAIPCTCLSRPRSPPASCRQPPRSTPRRPLSPVASREPGHAGDVRSAACCATSASTSTA